MCSDIFHWDVPSFFGLCSSNWWIGEYGYTNKPSISKQHYVIQRVRERYRKKKKCSPLITRGYERYPGQNRTFIFLGLPKCFRMSIHVCETASHIGGYPLQPERWLRIREAWGPGSLKFLFLNAGQIWHHNRLRVPQILRAFLVLYCRHLHNLEQAKVR